jgi:hypothetical protein
MCLYPRLIPNPKFKTSKKRGYYKPSQHDSRLNYVPIACGKCYECRKKRAREWKIRLAEEIRHEKSYFVTLTIDDENLEKIKDELEIEKTKGNENSIATTALRKFLERCRKKTKKSLRHWCVTELGEDNGRIHLHGIFFGENTVQLIIEKWKYGYVFIGTFVNERTINYITKYMLKDDINNREFSGKVLTSPGIGSKYFERDDWKFNKYRGEDTREYYIFRNGTKAMLPRYYREKIYSEEEREKLWIQKLDKGDTWVMKEKCKIDSEEYKNLLEYHRIRAIQLHGDNEILWKEKQYWKRLEKQRNVYRKRKHTQKYINKETAEYINNYEIGGCPF